MVLPVEVDGMIPARVPKKGHRQHLAHCCAYGPNPHSIKIYMYHTRTDNDQEVFAKLKSIVEESQSKFLRRRSEN